MDSLLTQAIALLQDDWVIYALPLFFAALPVSYTHLRAHETVLDLVCRLLLEKSDDTLTHSFGPRHRLLLVGAGQLAANLSTLALAMDYEVLLADSREWALDQWQGPEVEKILGLPDDVVREHAADEHCAVITLSHDPRVDDMALMEALDSACWYVGALGSVRTTEKRLQRLSQLGLSSDVLARLHAPVGLSIGSKTTMEIAVSIMAQLTQLRRESNDLAQSAQPAEMGAR